MKPQLGALFFAALAVHSILAQQTQYNVGVGIADCTGPAGEITFVSFPHSDVKKNQILTSLHFRWATRAWSKRVLESTCVSSRGHLCSMTAHREWFSSAWTWPWSARRSEKRFTIFTACFVIHRCHFNLDQIRAIKMCARHLSSYFD